MKELYIYILSFVIFIIGVFLYNIHYKIREGIQQDIDASGLYGLSTDTVQSNDTQLRKFLETMFLSLSAPENYSPPTGQSRVTLCSKIVLCNNIYNALNSYSDMSTDSIMSIFPKTFLNQQGTDVFRAMVNSSYIINQVLFDSNGSSLHPTFANNCGGSAQFNNIIKILLPSYTTIISSLKYLNAIPVNSTHVGQDTEFTQY